MSSQVPNPEGLPEIRDGAGATDEPPEKKIISALHLVLMVTPLDTLTQAIDRLHLKYSITVDNPATNEVRMRVFNDGMLRYEAVGKGLKAAITNCLAKVLAGEKRDIHEY